LSVKKIVSVKRLQTYATTLTRNKS